MPAQTEAFLFLQGARIEQVEVVGFGVVEVELQLVDFLVELFNHFVVFRLHFDQLLGQILFLFLQRGVFLAVILIVLLHSDSLVL